MLLFNLEFFGWVIFFTTNYTNYTNYTNLHKLYTAKILCYCFVKIKKFHLFESGNLFDKYSFTDFYNSKTSVKVKLLLMAVVVE